MDQAKYFFVSAATGECCEEIEHWQREVEQAPDDPEAWMGLGLARQRRNEDLQALDAYDRALALDPTLERAHHNRGVSLHSLGRGPQAVEAYREALRLNPRYVRAHVALGGALCKLGQETEALAAWETAIELDPAWYEAHHNLGALLRKQGEHALAVESFARAAALEPNEEDPDRRRAALAELHFFWAESWMELGRVSDAIATYRKAIELRPDDAAEAHNRLGAAHDTVGHPELAVAEFEAAVMLEPYHPLYWANLGQACLRFGRWADAREAFAEAHRLAPSIERITKGLAEALHLLGREKEAAEILLSVPALPDTPEDRYDTLNLLGNVYRRLRRWDEAVAMFKQAIPLLPDELGAHVNLFHAYLGGGNRAAARAQVEAVRRLDPKKASQLAANLDDS